MKLDRYYTNPKLLDTELDNFEQQQLLRKTLFAVNLVQAHIDKAKHNLKFFAKNAGDEEYNDWLIVTLYYAIYHAALALVANKGYISKSHDATILFLIKEYDISKNDAELLNDLSLNKTDAEFYTDIKEKRKQASYATNTLFRTDKIEEYRKKSIEFLNKAEDMLNNKNANP
jgi:uncharacterized protein (UPF0332 family)